MHLNRLVAVAGFLLASVPVAICQEAPSADVFVGTWKMNPNKSSQAGIDSESIRIELAGDQHKFFFGQIR